MGGLATPRCASLEGDQLIDLPLRDGLHLATAVLPQPGVDVLSGGCAPLVLGAQPALTGHQSGHGRGVGHQDTGSVRQLNLSLVAADLLNDHGVESLTTHLRYQRTQQPAKGVLCQCWNWFFLAHRVAVGQVVW